MTTSILDTSAIIAVIKSEVGADRVRPHMNGATVSAVTIAELVTVLTREGHAPEIVVAIIEQLRFIVEPFGLESALTTGLLQAKTSRHGLSLGDRACLALAIDRKLPVLTADRAWRDLDLGIEIRVVR